MKEIIKALAVVVLFLAAVALCVAALIAVLNLIFPRPAPVYAIGTELTVRLTGEKVMVLTHQCAGGATICGYHARDRWHKNVYFYEYELQP